MDLVAKITRLAPRCFLGLYGLTFATTLLVGCGSGVESYVSGEVTVDGNALAHGRVVFSPRGDGAIQGATGQIDDDGHYRVQSGRSGGLNAGEYAVIVSSRAPSIPSKGDGPPAPGKLLTPKKYRSAATTDLIVKVKPGSNSIDLMLSSE